MTVGSPRMTFGSPGMTIQGRHDQGSTSTPVGLKQAIDDGARDGKTSHSYRFLLRTVWHRGSTWSSHSIRGTLG